MIEIQYEPKRESDVVYDIPKTQFVRCQLQNKKTLKCSNHKTPLTQGLSTKVVLYFIVSIQFRNSEHSSLCAVSTKPLYITIKLAEKTL